ncbi:MAG: hypothetical protein IPI49_29480 [Myxococcales bacterium]|nr:hypothetical protein [Myxococcales bacterium]
MRLVTGGAQQRGHQLTARAAVGVEAVLAASGAQLIAHQVAEPGGQGQRRAVEQAGDLRVLARGGGQGHAKLARQLHEPGLGQRPQHRDRRRRLHRGAG